MKKLALLSLAVLSLSTPVLAGDPVVGKQKATACIACHGSEGFGGIFYTLQLGGRDADKLVVKTMKYKTGKVLHPMMNIATAFFSEQEIEDVAAYYKSLGKPAFVSPLFKIQGDEDNRTVAAASAMAAPVPVATTMAAPAPALTYAAPTSGYASAARW